MIKLKKKKTLTKISIIFLVLIFAVAAFFFVKVTFTGLAGTSSFPYTYNSGSRKAMFFGSNYFAPSPLKFNCINDYSSGTIRTGRSPNECWSTDIEWHQEGNIEEFTMFAGETRQLNKYLEVTFNPSGHVRYGCYMHQETEVCLTGQFKKETDWSNNFVFKIINTDFLTSKAVDDDYEILLNSEKNMKVEITNDFAPDLRGGLWIKTTNLMLFREKTSNSYFYLDKGTKTYEKTPVSSDFLGKLGVERKVFIIINNNVEDIKIMNTNPTYIEYKVVRELTGETCEDSVEICCSDGILRRKCDADRLGISGGTDCNGDIESEEGDYPEDETEETEWKSTITYWWVIPIVFIVLLALVIYIWRKK